VISSITPAIGTSDGGTLISVSGANFVSGTVILVGGVAASDVTVLDPGTITAVTPVHAPGLADVVVTVPWPGGGTAILDKAFTYEAQDSRKPADPSDLNWRANGSSLTLTWVTAAMATSYLVEIGSAPGLEDILQQDVGSATELTISTSPGTYFVRVRAKNDHGLSGPSNEVVVTIVEGA
jgi:hypothetical protein